MPDDPKPAALVEFHITGIRGLYIPFVGGFVRLIPPADVPHAQAALDNARKAWLN